MNWTYLRRASWLDTRAKFVQHTPRGGSLLDLASAGGETLGHFFELRPDLRFHAVDILGAPERYPPGCVFFRGDLQKDRLPWPDGSMDAVTCMHLVEHIHCLDHLLSEIFRVLKPGGRAYLETPHPKTVLYSSAPGNAAGQYTRNFYDDLSHLRPVSTGALAQYGRAAGFAVVRTGISRNWLFALSHLFYMFRPPSRKKNTAWGHFHGWSAYLVAQKGNEADPPGS